MTPDALLSAENALFLGGVCLFFIATMAIYAGRCATIGVDDELAPARGASLIPAWLRGWWRWLCSPLVRACRALDLPAEAVALAGVTASAIAAAGAVSGSLPAAGWTYLGAVGLGGVAGELARLQGRPGRATALLDGALGRFAELLVLGAVGYAVREHGAALIAALCAIGATMLASDARLRSEALGAALPNRASWFGRSERALLIGLPCGAGPTVEVLLHPGAALDILAAALGLLAALAIVSAVRRIHTAHEALRTIDALSANPREPSRRLRVVRGGRA